ncbi:MAG: dTDP-4-dehydrorhamnose reductase [Chitinophagaceae bacterium]
MRKTILVTGAHGQVGSELKQLSIAFPFYKFSFVSRGELNISDASAVNDLFQSSSFSYCINCAAYTAVDKAEIETDAAFAVNAEAPAILAAACREFNTGFIHISTDYVFDGTASEPYTETAVTNPMSVYGRSKLEGEKKAVAANPETIIIRTAWVYSEFGKNFVKTMLRLMNEKQEIGVVNDQYGSPTYAADIAEAIMTIVNSGEWHPGIYHFSNQGIISWFDFANAIRQIINSNCKVNQIATSQYPTPAKRPAYSVLNSGKISDVYAIKLKPWEPRLKVCLGRLIQ